MEVAFIAQGLYVLQFYSKLLSGLYVLLPVPQLGVEPLISIRKLTSKTKVKEALGMCRYTASQLPYLSIKTT